MKLFGALRRQRHKPHSVPTEIVFQKVVDQVPLSGDNKNYSYHPNDSLSSTFCDTSQLTDEQYYIDRYEGVIATEESDDEHSAFDSKVLVDLQIEREKIKEQVRRLLREHDDDNNNGSLEKQPWRMVHSPKSEDATKAASSLGLWMFACYGDEKCRGQ